MARPVIVRVGSGGNLYVCPGRNTSDQSQLWKYDGTTASLAWTAPNDGDGSIWQITCLYPWAGKLLIFLSDEVLNQRNRVYQYSPASGTATKVVDNYLPDVPNGIYEPARQVVTLSGKMLVHHAGYTGMSSLCRLDPSLWTITTLQSDWTYSDYGSGGVAVSSDGNVYWCDGRKVYSSTDGSAGSFTIIYDTRGAFGGGEVSGLFYLSDGYIYFGGRYADVFSDFRQRVHRLRSDAVMVTRDVSVGTYADNQLALFATDSDGVVTMEWGSDVSNNWHSYVNGGASWAADLTMANRLGLTPGGIIVFRGKVYFGLDTYGTATISLYRRDGPGSATLIRDWNNYEPFYTYQGDMPMAVV